MASKNNSELIFAQQLRGLMKARGITQKQLADAVNVTQGAVSNWLKGAVIQSEKLLILADYFHVTTDELLTGREAFHGIQHAVKEAESFYGTPEEKQLKFERVAAGLYPPSLAAKFDRLAFLEKENRCLRAALEQFRKQIDKLLETP